MLRFFFVTALFFASALNAWWPWNTTKVSFDCPHGCGQWGTDEIQKIEWDFVVCLYEADKWSSFIGHNLRKLFRQNEYELARYVPQEMGSFNYEMPEGFQSEWYFKMLENQGQFRLFLTDELYGSEIGDFGAGWAIRHENRANGQHLGKRFIRSIFTDLDSEEDCEDEEGNPISCGWNYQGDQVFSFGNIIDFENACRALEHDLASESREGNYRNLNRTPLLRVAVDQKHNRIIQELDKVRANYKKIFSNCLNHHQAISAQYTLALYQLYEREYGKALENIRSVVLRADLDTLENKLASKICQSYGGIELELGFFDNAIVALKQAIDRDPYNRVAYLDLATAYFEKGQFDKGFEHYLKSEAPFTSHSRFAYASGFVRGIKQGATHCLEKFIPNMVSSARGLSHGLWAFAMHPVDTSIQIVQSSEAIIQYIREHAPIEVAKRVIPELHELVSLYDSLSEERRGELTGIVIGKYGLEVLTFYAGGKGWHAYQELKSANTVMTFKAMTSAASKKNLLSLSKKWSQRSEQCLGELKNGSIRSDQKLYQALRNQQLSELQIRRVIHDAGVLTYPKPSGIPAAWDAKITKKNFGMKYVNPLNPSESVRISPGISNSPFPMQREPYVIQKHKSGLAYAKNGRLVPANSPEAHIPLAEYKYFTE